MPTQPLFDLRYVSVIAGVAFTLVLGLPADSWAAPEASQLKGKLKNVEMCNGVDRTSTEPQIKGCTAIIESGKETTLVLAIAHTNRGNAYAAKGDFDNAIGDYDAAIKYNPNFSKPFNNRGVAFLK
jgi:tetratricopeptide (TPR) repeat protein